ncbi:cell division protein ZapD [Alishewanella sp. 16-MA]|uniref:Cell division protein ZapD n=1 Tax=Alishewanella maricola TaxID=2795740 RepID=A0ABS8C6V8_9ALTE|nr:cell division protein ZapD [Alishewanella maricola]MDP4944511.1 cell division protein ZapD [Alishewanella sp.]MDP5037113.1 cell division protein ZapD [Alishewanella sp.]MDP5187066.1 cell division protein ZapD [Alishewanella sp.]
MTTAELIYEHPLNEKIRTYLRVEHLFTQLNSLADLENEAQQLSYFSALFTLIDVLDRHDIRPDLLKDIERCENQLVQWSRHPSVSDKKLQVMLQQALRLQSDLLRSGKLSSPIKDDVFLAPLRQRFGLPGGCCYFDMPQLQYWLALPQAERQQQRAEWHNALQQTEQAIQFVLSFVRERGHFQTISSDNGFYQQNAEQFELLRIKYQQSGGSFPTVSGNRYRYAIRFMQLTEQAGRSVCAEAVSFQLACC